MELLSWQPEYTVGIPSADAEHRELIDLINQCYDRLEISNGPGAVEKFLDDIQTHIATHFEHEEHAMHEAEYGEYRAHRKDHEALLMQLGELKDRYVAHPNTGRAVLQYRLSTWFGHHFSTYDSRLHRQLGPQRV